VRAEDITGSAVRSGCAAKELRVSDPLLDKPLPQNLDAERSVLGSILIDNALCDQAAKLLQPSDFFLAPHRRMFERMLALHEKNQPIDLVTLTDGKDAKDLGGKGSIADLIITQFGARIFLITQKGLKLKQHFVALSRLPTMRFLVH